MTIEQAEKYCKLFAPGWLWDAPAIAKRCAQDEHSWFWFEPSVLDQHDKRPIVLIYSSCTANQIRTYIREVRTELKDSFRLCAVLTHQLQLDAGEARSDLVSGLFTAADFIFVNVLAPKFGWTATHRFLERRKPGSLVVTFVPPTFAAFWPCCVPFGEEGVQFHMDEGLDENQIVGLFHRGEFEPCFDVRFKSQLDNLALRENERDVKLSEFIRAYHKKVKMFFSFNHGSYHVMAHLTDQLLENVGFGKYDLDRVLNVDTNGGRFGAFFPETIYEFEHYQFDYPLRWPNDRGGSKFYEAQIRESFAKQTALRARGEKEYSDPLDDL